MRQEMESAPFYINRVLAMVLACAMFDFIGTLLVGIVGYASRPD